MKKINIRFLLASISVVAVIGLVSFFAYKAENFWINFSLNLLTEIIGAILVAAYLKTNISKGFADLTKEIKSQMEIQRDIQKIKRAFDTPDPESAWDMVVEFKKRQLESKKTELAAIDANDSKKRNQIIAEIEVLEKYISVAGVVSNKIGDEKK